MSDAETVQYFQFDGDSNMYIFPASSGCSGIPKLVRPGDEMIFNSSVKEEEKLDENCIGTTQFSEHVAFSETVAETQFYAPSTARLYNVPLDENTLEDLTHKNFAPETMKKIRWVTKMYREWRNYRNRNPQLENIECDLDDQSTFSEQSLIFAVSHFVTEVKKLDGSDFPGKTLYDIVICIQFHLETKGFAWKLLNDNTFKDVKFVLDNVMKIRTQQGLGTSVCKTQIFTPTYEDILWSLGLLGESAPEILLTTVTFLIWKGFALRAGKEHHQLRCPPYNSQFAFLSGYMGYSFLRYTEDIGLKTNKGGIKHRKVEAKQVDMYPQDNMDRCPIHIILKYLSLLPKNRTCHSLYLQAKKKFSPGNWYINRPVRENKLRDTVKELCKTAGIPGFYSNHSLRATAATRLYRNNIDEQLIQEITGHRSLAVRSYKKTSDHQRRIASKCLFQC